MVILTVAQIWGKSHFLCLYIVLQFWKGLDPVFALKLEGHRLDIFSAHKFDLVQILAIIELTLAGIWCNPAGNL